MCWLHRAILSVHKYNLKNYFNLCNFVFIFEWGKDSGSLKVLKMKFSRLLWVDLGLHADSWKAFIQNPATSILSVLVSKGFFFLFLSTLYSRSEIPFQGDLNNTQALSHSAMWCFTPRELLEVSPAAEEIVGRHSACSLLSRAWKPWCMKTVWPKMGNPTSALLVLHLFAFVIWEDELPGWRFGSSESYVGKNVMTVPLTSIVKRKIAQLCPTVSVD